MRKRFTHEKGTLPISYWINKQFESARPQPTVVSQKLFLAALEKLTQQRARFGWAHRLHPFWCCGTFVRTCAFGKPGMRKISTKLANPSYICFVARVTVCSVLMPTQGVLFVLNVLVTDFDMRQFSINFPIMISIQTMALAASVFFVKNRQIAAIVNQVQDVVDNRECLRWIWNDFVNFSPKLIMGLVILKILYDLAPFCKCCTDSQTYFHRRL